MLMIKDGIDYGIRNKLRGFYKKQKFSDATLLVLENITERQEKKFNNKKLIPYPLLQFFWDLDFLPIIERPIQGMRVRAFLDLLLKGEYKTERHQYKGTWLRDKIEDEEFPETNRIQEMYLKVPGEGHKWVPVSYFRGMPGTIIK